VLINDLLAKASTLQIAGAKEKDHAKIEESHQILLSVIDSAPDDPSVLFLLATSFLIQGHNGVAIPLLKRALCAAPCDPAIHCNLASAYRGEEMNQEAERHLIIANTLREDTEYLGNLAALWVNRGHPDRGIPYGERALELCPTNAKAAWNLSLLYLEQMNFDRGFSLYTAGIDAGDRLVKPYTRETYAGEVLLPMWKGEKGKRVVVYGEQGIGDEIMFASAIEDLAKDCESVLIDAHPRLVGLMKRSFSTIENVIAVEGNRKSDDVSWVKEYNPDFMLPIGNLFYHYRRYGEFPRKQYLSPDPEKSTMYRRLLESFGPPPYIGFSWIGGSKRTHAVFRNAKLGHFREMFDLPATFVSLQYTDVRDKITRFNEGLPDGKKLHEIDGAVKAFDYDETAALVSELDMVVSVCTSVVHLCGAMGVPCYVMTPFERAWRYGPAGTMYQYGDWVQQIHKGPDEPWDEFSAEVIERIWEWVEERKSL